MKSYVTYFFHSGPQKGFNVFVTKCVCMWKPSIFFINDKSVVDYHVYFNALNRLNPELNPIRYFLALLAHHFLQVSRIRVKSLSLRLLMSYIYIYIYRY